MRLVRRLNMMYYYLHPNNALDNKHLPLQYEEVVISVEDFQTLHYIVAYDIAYNNKVLTT